MTQIIKHHVAIVQAFLVYAFFRKTIVVIPRLHLRQHRFDVGFGTQLAVILIVLEHRAHIRFRKAEHVVETRVLRDVPADIITARKVI